MQVQSITIPRLITANDRPQTTMKVTMALSNKAATRSDDGAYISKRIHPITLFNLAALIIQNNTESLAIFKYPLCTPICVEATVISRLDSETRRHLTLQIILDKGDFD